jgi:hypothetical protein
MVAEGWHLICAISFLVSLLGSASSFLGGIELDPFSGFHCLFPFLELVL